MTDDSLLLVADLYWGGEQQYNRVDQKFAMGQLFNV